MSGAGAVVSLVLLEWTVGWIGAAAWTQSWSAVRRGHFRIIGYCTLALAVLALLSVRSAAPSATGAIAWTIVVVVGAGAYAVVQFVGTDLVGAVVGGLVAAAGTVALIVVGGLVAGWPAALASIQLVSGALLLGAVTNGMLLGHWYLNQPGLNPSVLARLTSLSLLGVIVSGFVGMALAGRLGDAATEGAVLGIPGFGDSFGPALIGTWFVLLAGTGVVVWMARRCITIRSIQSATGLYYVALLTAGVSELLVRYLMVHSG
jgi:hypothetical protein